MDTSVTEVIGEALPDLDNTDILFLGGGSDREQQLVCQKLLRIRDKIEAYAQKGGVIIAVSKEAAVAAKKCQPYKINKWIVGPIVHTISISS